MTDSSPQPHSKRPIAPQTAWGGLRGLVMFAALVGSGACHRKSETQQDTPLPSATPTAQTPAPIEDRARVRFETSEFTAGTLPGRFPRQPELEPALSTVKLGPFEIDARRYPGDGQSAPRKANLDTAGRLCAERSGRLCSELEWERACLGDEHQPFSTGDTWDCPDPTRCRSKLGLVGLGAVAEWTSSRFGNDSPEAGKAVSRASDDGPAEHHRCAHRVPAADQDAHFFRCCYGPPNGAKVAEPKQDDVFEFADVDAARLTALLASHPKTETLAKDVLLFSEPEAAETVVSRGPGDRKGFDFTVRPLTWRPVKGAEFLVVTGRSGEETSFVAVFHALPEGQYTIESAFTMQNEPGPIALAYSPSIKPRLHFSGCWGCLGETGKILYRDPDQAIVLQP